MDIPKGAILCGNYIFTGGISMNINYNVTGSDRQKLVRIISREIGMKAHYEGAPSMAYTIGGFSVSRDGALSWESSVDSQTVRGLTEMLETEGFRPAEKVELEERPIPDKEKPVELQEEVTPAIGENASPEEAEGLTISLPRDGFDKDSLDRLQKLVDSKASLIKKALGAVDLTIRVHENKVEFPWWKRMPEPVELQAYMAFVAALCAMAKEAKRVVATEKPVESEKFAFRVWLLRLGFGGPDYKHQRAILLKNLTGSASFPTIAAADAFSAAQKAKRDAEKSEADETAP